MTAELAFAKGFLGMLDAKPIKRQPDYAADPDSIEHKGPYTLPRMPHAMQAPQRDQAETGAAPGVDVLLKSTRNPPLNLTLTAQPLTTSVLDLKQRVAAELRLEGTEKIRVLWNKKPCSDSKSIRDVVGTTDSKQIEFGVMVMGGVPVKESGDSQQDPEEQAKQVLKSDAFWVDLEVFVQGKVGSGKVAKDAVGAFKQAWAAGAA